MKPGKQENWSLWAGDAQQLQSKLLQKSGGARHAGNAHLLKEKLIRYFSVEQDCRYFCVIDGATSDLLAVASLRAPASRVANRHEKMRWITQIGARSDHALPGVLELLSDSLFANARQNGYVLKASSYTEHEAHLPPILRHCARMHDVSFLEGSRWGEGTSFAGAEDALLNLASDEACRTWFVPSRALSPWGHLEKGSRLHASKDGLVDAMQVSLPEWMVMEREDGGHCLLYGVLSGRIAPASRPRRSP